VVSFGAIRVAVDTPVAGVRLARAVNVGAGSVCCSSRTSWGVDVGVETVAIGVTTWLGVGGGFTSATVGRDEGVGSNTTEVTAAPSYNNNNTSKIVRFLARIFSSRRKSSSSIFSLFGPNHGPVQSTTQC
jgi:hypothetical protein